MKFVSAQEIYRVPGSRKGLPAWTYNSDELTQLEMEQLFLRNWMFEVWLGVASFQNRLRELLPVVAREQAPEEGGLKALNERLLAQKNVAAVG